MSAEAVIAAARAAQSAWGAKPVRERVKVLRALRKRIAAEEQRIVDAVVADTQKVPLDAFTGDVLTVLEQMRFYERNAAWVLASRDVGKNGFLFFGCRFEQVYEPHGVVLVYAPANYPFQLTMVPVITALYAGNAVVLKASEKTPAVARVIRALCEGLPVFVVEDGPATAGTYLEARPDFLFFTGSTASGRKVAARAGELLIPSVLELGGKDAAIVFADCDLKRTVEGVTYGAFSNAGQVCIGIKRLYVARGIFQAFVGALVERVKALRYGVAGECDFGPIDGALCERLAAQVKDAVERGATLVVGDAARPEAPMVLTGVASDARLMVEDSFGPVLCVFAFDSEDEAIAAANASEFALGGSVWTNDAARGQRVALRMRSGACAVNDVIRGIANPHAAFGGNAGSGWGRYHGAEGLQSFSRVKTVMTTKVRMPREVHWLPLKNETMRLLRGVVAMRHRPAGWWRRMFSR